MLDPFRAVTDKVRENIQNGNISYTPLEQARISGSLFHLMPHLPVEQHKQIIGEILLHQRVAALEPMYWQEIYPKIQAHGPGLRATQGREPAIFCSFHYGSYRMVLPWLIENQGPVTMLIDHGVASSQGERFRQMLDQFTQARGQDADLIIRDTSDAKVVLRLLRDLRRGRHVLLFVDANLGTQANADPADEGPSAHTLPLPFLGARLRVKTGASALSCLSQRPVVPILPVRGAIGSGDVVLQVLNPIMPGKNRTTHAHLCMQALWSALEGALRKDLSPWECWRYIDRSLDPSALSRILVGSSPHTISQRIWRLHDQRYILETRSTPTRILFDRCLMRSFLISEELANTLGRLAGTSVPGTELMGWDGMSEGTLDGLVQRGLIIEAEGTTTRLNG